MVPSLVPVQNLFAEMKCQLSSKMPQKQVKSQLPSGRKEKCLDIAGQGHMSRLSTHNFLWSLAEEEQLLSKSFILLGCPFSFPVATDK